MAFLSAYFQIQASYKSRLAFPLFRELVRLNSVHYGAVPGPPYPCEQRLFLGLEHSLLGQISMVICGSLLKDVGRLCKRDWWMAGGRKGVLSH